MTDEPKIFGDISVQEYLDAYPHFVRTGIVISPPAGTAEAEILHFLGDLQVICKDAKLSRRLRMAEFLRATRDFLHRVDPVHQSTTTVMDELVLLNIALQDLEKDHLAPILTPRTQHNRRPDPPSKAILHGLGLAAFWVLTGRGPFKEVPFNDNPVKPDQAASEVDRWIRHDDKAITKTRLKSWEDRYRKASRGRPEASLNEEVLWDRVQTEYIDLMERVLSRHGETSFMGERTGHAPRNPLKRRAVARDILSRSKAYWDAFNLQEEEKPVS